jgi:flagellum-specific peptidoglycan hydrolase FlgJ
MAAEDIENKVRKMSSQKPEDGKDLQQFQEAQNQIVQINAERQGNLQTARLENNADAANNETMSQAVEMAALGGLGGGASVQQQVQSMNPQTQAVLGKYGLGQPKVQRTSSRSVQVTPQKITINNNTTNTTTNNVAVPAANIGGPVQGRTLAVKQNPDEGQARFKTWISNAFAKQNQQAAAREKEYQRREWSLTRSTNKLMKHLSDLGKSVSERLDPRKLASSVGGQFKTILFLFGTMFLAKHWKRIVKFAANVESFLFGEVNPNDPKAPRGRSGFSKMLISLFGGDPEGKDGIVDSLSKLFWNKEKNGILQLLGDKISNFFKERGDAIKAIKVPELDLGNLPDTVTKLIEYLGNILKAGFGGADAIKDIVSSNIKQVGKESSMASEAMEGRAFKSAKGVNVKNTSWGDATTVSKPGSNGYLNSWDISSDNKITNTAGEVRQAGTISRMLNDKTSNTVNVASVMSGMERLKNTADTKGGVLISEDFISGLRNLIDTKGLFNNEDLSIKRFKFVKREKTDDDYYREGADWKKRGVEGFAKRSAINAGRNVGADGYLIDIGDAIATGDIIQDPAWKAVSEGVKGLWNKAWADKYTLDMVPLDDPRRGEVLEVEEYDGPEYNVNSHTGARKTKKVNKSVFEFYEATPSFFEKVRARLGEKLNNENFSFNTSDEASLKQMEGLMTQLKKKQLEDNRKYFEANHISFDPVIKNIHSDIDINKQFEGYHNAISESERRDKEFEKKYESSPMKKSGEYISDAVDGVKDYFSGKIKKYPALAKNQKEFVDKMRAVYKDVLMKKGIDTKYADVLTAQSALESAWGKSQSGKFNFSGIKADKDDIDKGLYTVCKTTEYENGVEKKIYDKFRDFKSLEDFAEYKVNFVNRDRYRAFDGDGINDYINRVVKGGYATAPNYGEILADTVKNIQSNYPDKSLENPPVINDVIKPTTSPDASGTYLAGNNPSTSTAPDNYVEQKTDKRSSVPTYDWNSAGVNSLGGDSGLIMAQNSVLAPEKVTPNTPASEKSIPGNTSESAGRELIADTEKDRTEDLYTKVSDINENIKLLSKTSIAQAEAINNVSTAIASLKFGGNINMGGGDGRTKVQSITTPPYRG